MRQKLLNTLLIASFGALAATASAQTTTPADNNTPAKAPVGTAAPSTMGTTGTQPGNMQPSAMDNGVPTDMKGYKSARAACDTQPLDMRDKCRTTLNTRYSAVAPKCQKLLGSALDDCLKGNDTAQ
ncbi:MAG TPA: hypothetical protein VGQ88_05115 [Burkholderiales bacterium]|nr:hypothetical protein [Burkholderiales bacterium]